MNHCDCPSVGCKGACHTGFEANGHPTWSGVVNLNIRMGRKHFAQWHLNKVAIGWSDKPVVFELVFEGSPCCCSLSYQKFFFSFFFFLTASSPMFLFQHWSRRSENPRACPNLDSPLQSHDLLCNNVPTSSPWDLSPAAMKAVTS